MPSLFKTMVKLLGGLLLVALGGAVVLLASTKDAQQSVGLTLTLPLWSFLLAGGVLAVVGVWLTIHSWARSSRLYRVRVPAELDAKVRTRMAAGGFDTLSEYIRSTVRADIERLQPERREPLSTIEAD